MSQNHARQADLAVVFGHKQPWVARMQSRTVDPMPRDLAGARAWGARLGLLASAPQSADIPSPPPALFAPPPVVAPVAPAGALELEELRLKSARADLLETQHALQTGKLLRAEDVEQREVAIASEFRHAACEYPLKARAILERHIAESPLVDRIVADLQPLAAELLNKSDARQALRGKPRDEIRATLTAWTNTVMETIE